MRLIHFILALLIALLGIAANASGGIYKLVDENGRVTHSNAPAKGAQKIQLNASDPSGPKLVAKAAIASPSSVRRDSFPTVSMSQQKRRDDKRRQILENELAEETKHLVEMQHALEDATKSIQKIAASQANLASDPIDGGDKVKDLRKQVSLHERNIMALRKELEKL